jgi:hypothetical protein
MRLALAAGLGATAALAIHTGLLLCCKRYGDVWIGRMIGC